MPLDGTLTKDLRDATLFLLVTAYRFSVREY